TCPDCAGTRLRPESRVVTVNGQTIIAVSRLPLNDLGAWLGGLPAVLSPDEMIIAEPILVDLSERITRLVEVGAGYLTLERSSPQITWSTSAQAPASTAGWWSLPVHQLKLQGSPGRSPEITWPGGHPSLSRSAAARQMAKPLPSTALAGTTSRTSPCAYRWACWSL